MMETLEFVVEDTILPHDKDLIGTEAEAIIRLINWNPFADRIWSLLLNPEIAVKPVKNKKDQISAPNCIGTALFVAGVSDLGYPYHAYESDLDANMEQPEPALWDDCLYPSECRYPERKRSGSLCFSYFVQGEDWHAGIYLGQVQGEDVLFAQHGHGKPFCVETKSRNYSAPNFYVPRTLWNREVEI